jgi:hypothetical protein
MKPSKVDILIMGCLLLIAANVFGGQASRQTLIDLRKDGRVISGTRKNFLIQGVNIYQDNIRNNRPLSKLAIKLSQTLTNKLVASDIEAIVVPDGKTAGRYMIGVLIGEETLPEDYEIDNSDFVFLSRYARDQKTAEIERFYRRIRSSVLAGSLMNLTAGSLLDITARIDNLHSIVSSVMDTIDRSHAELYAGYLLSELADTPIMQQKPDELVKNYRAEWHRLIDKPIRESIRSGELGWFQPVEVTGEKSILTIAELSNSDVTRQSFVGENRPTGRPLPNYSYLTIWQGRSLVIVPEKPGTKMGPLWGSNEQLKTYFRRYNPNIQADAIIPSGMDVLSPKVVKK